MNRLQIALNSIFAVVATCNVVTDIPSRQTENMDVLLFLFKAVGIIR